MPKRDIPPLAGERVCLRLLREQDLPTTLAWRNADWNRVWFFDSTPVAQTQHEQWFRRYLERDDDFVWMIEQIAPHRPIGQLSLYHVEWTRRRAEFGRLLIGELAVRGQGLASEATRLALHVGTGNLGLTEIYCSILIDNLASQAACAAAGFLREGLDGSTVRMVYLPSDHDAAGLVTRG